MFLIRRINIPNADMASPSPLKPKFTRKSNCVSTSPMTNSFIMVSFSSLFPGITYRRRTKGMSQTIYCPENTVDTSMNVIMAMVRTRHVSGRSLLLSRPLLKVQYA